MKTVKDWIVYFGKETRETQKNTLGTDRGVEIEGNNMTQKRKCSPNWIMKLLALEYYWNKSASGFRKQKGIHQNKRIANY